MTFVIPGVAPLGSIPLSSIPPFIAAGIPDPFALLLENPDADFTFLFVGKPYDPRLRRVVSGVPGPLGATPLSGPPLITVTGSERTVYLSDKGFKTGPSEIPANTDFPSRLLEPYNFEVDAFQDAEPSGVATPGQVVQQQSNGAAATGSGAIIAKNGDGGLDDWIDWGWDGRVIELKAGGPGFALADFATVWRGVAAGISWDREKLTWPIRDLSQLFAQPIARRIYAGTGGLEGGADLAGKPVPLAFGDVTAVEPVLIDAPNLVYQWHDGPVESVARITDMGIPLVSDGDLADVYSWSPVPGDYVTANGSGLIRLGEKPAGKLALDGEGDASATGYVATPAAIVKRIATTRMGAFSLADPGDLDGGAFASADDAFPYAVGVYLPDQVNADQAMDALMATANGWWTFTRAGLLTVGLIAAPANPTRTIADKDIIEARFQLQRVIPPSWRRAVGYQQVWNVHGPADLAGLISDADRLLLTNPFRFPEPAEDDGQRTLHRMARDVIRLSLLADLADAEAVQEAQQDAHGVERRVYQVPVPRGLFRFWLGDVVTLQRSRYGLDNGKPFLVAGITEIGRGNKVTLRLWG